MDKKYCGKCYKLDRINDKCERYHEPVKLVKAGVFPVYEKCQDCQDGIAPYREEKPRNGEECHE